MKKFFLAKRFISKGNNMEREQKIAQEIDKTLGFLEHSDRLKPSPFFYIRLQARIDAQEKKSVSQWFPGILKPALLVLLLAVNILTVVFFLSNDTSESTATVRSALKSEFAREFGLQVTTNEFLITQ